MASVEVEEISSLRGNGVKPLCIDGTASAQSLDSVDEDDDQFDSLNRHFLNQESQELSLNLWAPISQKHDRCEHDATSTQTHIDQQHQSWVTSEAQPEEQTAVSQKPRQTPCLDSVENDDLEDRVQHLRRVYVTLQAEHNSLRTRLGLELGDVVEVSAVVRGSGKDSTVLEKESPVSESVTLEALSAPASPSAANGGRNSKRTSILLPPTSSILDASSKPRRKESLSVGKSDRQSLHSKGDRNSLHSNNSFAPRLSSDNDVKVGRDTQPRMSLLLTGPSGEGFEPVMPHQMESEEDYVSEECDYENFSETGSISCTVASCNFDSRRHSVKSTMSRKSVKSVKSVASVASSVQTNNRPTMEQQASMMSARSVRSGVSVASRKSYHHLFTEKALQAYSCWTSDCDDDLHRRIKLFNSTEHIDGAKRTSDRHSFTIRNSLTGGRTSIKSFLGGLTAAMPMIKQTSSSNRQRRESFRIVLSRIASGDAYAVDPSSTGRMFWNVISVALLIYDLVFIPLQIFEMPITSFSSFMRWFSVGFWSCDIFASFWVGFLREGVAELRLREVRWRYLRTWFLFDVFFCIIDVVNAAMCAQRDANEHERLQDVFGALRFLRIMKLPRLISQMIVHIQSQLSLVVLGIVKLMAMILALNHCIACVWYGISRWTEASSTWLKEKSEELTGDPVLYFYTLSLHWSLTQFTPATMEVHPENVSERIFAIVVIYFALITFSSFVSSITNAMTHLRQRNEEKNMQFEKLQRYFHGNHISLSLRVRVRRHLDHLLAQRAQFVDERDVLFLSELSGPLRIELRYEVFSPVLRVHGFFQRYDELFQGSMQKICFTAVDQLCLSVGDKLFSMGEKASKMYVIRSGEIEYRHHVGKTELVNEGQWLAEVPLWAAWIHHGDSIAVDECALVTLDAELFQEAVVHNRAALLGPSYYALLFVEYLNSCSRMGLSDLVDPMFNMERALDVAFAEFFDTESRVSGMSHTKDDPGSPAASHSLSPGLPASSPSFSGRMSDLLAGKLHSVMS